MVYLSKNQTNSLVFFILLVALIGLQVYLSRRKNKFLGLILPSVGFIYSIIAVLNIAEFGNETPGQIILKVLMVLIVANIPSLILLAIYLSQREKINKNKEIDKMNIKDL